MANLLNEMKQVEERARERDLSEIIDMLASDPTLKAQHFAYIQAKLQIHIVNLLVRIERHLDHAGPC